MMNVTRKSQMSANAAQAYQDSLRKNLEHRLQVARNQGNQKLVEQLEQEATYLHLK
ncbi:hypothetical protein [Geminocystis sp. GBBB08]|uniref:arginine synthesis PII-interacting regulator PirA n=1 Tax=Geminocystis sp. GBBB08 TaxID=2604140 RepID=UPI0027E307B1|nr:hypothetical protein [Geminocystis sp. GBBB08]